MQNINDTYFDGYYKEIWRVIIPDELTVKEVDFIMQYFNLKPGSKVLDMMCGFGRHAIGLARKGIVVTAVDNLSDYISEIKEIAEQDNLPLLSVQSDIINYASDDSFDLAICMGNSLNFFNAEDSEKIMSNICRQLRPGGKFLINTWSLTEIIAKSFKEREWSRAGQLKFLTECKYLFHPTRMEVEHTVVAPDNTIEIKTGVDYVFSVAEMETMLNESGFNLKEIYSIPGKKKFSLGEPRAYLIAEKRV